MFETRSGSITLSYSFNIIYTFGYNTNFINTEPAVG